MAQEKISKKEALRRHALIQGAARAVAKSLPSRHGFIIMAFPFDDPDGNTLLYASNAKREDVLNVLKEFLLRSGAAEDWMKDIR